ncbi:MAG: hypothetical protein ACI9U0_001845, partial [Flavobacteriales bacterium]
MFYESAANNKKTSIMSIYKDYIKEIEERKDQDLNPQP